MQVIAFQEKTKGSIELLLLQLQRRTPGSLNTLVNLDDEQGLEIFYDAAVTPWFRFGADLQAINPAQADNQIAVVGGLRATVSF
jgi:carbohydrate-selective porin OprB